MSENVEKTLPCGVCGRQFAPDSLSRHEPICYKTASKKRKPFDAGKQRAQNSDIPIQSVIKVRKEVEKNDGRFPRPKTGWRENHEDFIRAVRSAKVVEHAIKTGAPLPPPPKSIVPKNYVQCEHCGRNFNPSAAERHVPFCKEQHERIGGKINAKPAPKPVPIGSKPVSNNAMRARNPLPPPSPSTKQSRSMMPRSRTQPQLLSESFDDYEEENPINIPYGGKENPNNFLYGTRSNGNRPAPEDVLYLDGVEITREGGIRATSRGLQNNGGVPNGVRVQNGRVPSGRVPSGGPRPPRELSAGSSGSSGRSNRAPSSRYRSQSFGRKSIDNRSIRDQQQQLAPNSFSNSNSAGNQRTQIGGKSSSGIPIRNGYSSNSRIPMPYSQQQRTAVMQEY